MFKNTLLILLIIFLDVSVFKCSNVSDTTDTEPETYSTTNETEDNEPIFYYEIIDGLMTITGGWRLKSVMEIPDSIDGHLVEAIGHGAFKNLQYIESVTLPEGLKEIQTESFSHCFSLAYIDIPDSVIYIGNGAFEFCSSLKSIILPSNITAIFQNTFQYSGLTSITVPYGVTEIHMEAFMQCTSLTEIYLPNGLSLIGSNAFNNCTSLNSIYLPTSVKYLDSSSFSYDSGLTVYVAAASQPDSWEENWDSDVASVVWGSQRP